MRDFLEDLGHGVHAIDTGYVRPRFDAAYLIVEAGRAAFIDCGVNHGVTRLLQALERLHLGVDCVDWVLPTHVHLDHAGGAGLLMQALPNARLATHPRGLRHLIDPSQLWAGAMAVYGEAEMERSYGRIVAVPAERTQALADGEIVQLAGRALRILDTPGHARHHVCIWDEKSRGVFTGDTFGISYREFDTAQGPWIFPTSSPVQFEPEAMKESVRRILALGPEVLYLTHYGRIGEVPQLAAMMIELIDATVAEVLPLRHADERHERMMAALRGLYLERLQRHGCQLAPEVSMRLLDMDVELNAQGLAIWLDRPQT
ncbi:MAG: MBL fold metallo-hydrolase [Paucibacter sp.]|nr:MBL fold metallo-hydrolase [Roseateles sp.]